MIKLIQRHLVAFLATLAIAFPAAATTYSTDYTDLWWGGNNESGWGINLIQQGEIIFATMFVYAQDNTAHWYSASALAPVGGSTTNYTGELTESRGPWLGTPNFDPNAVTRISVGAMTVSFSGPNNGTLSYNVGNTNVTKQITRITWRNVNLAGNYIGGMLGRSSGCSGVAAGQVAVFDNLTVTQNGTQVSMRVDFNQGGTGTASVCTYTGTLSQAGRLASLSGGSYSCSVGGSTANQGTFSLSAIDAGVNGFHATFTSQDQFCSSYSGRFGGVRDVP
jgi:hypothetical protein